MHHRAETLLLVQEPNHLSCHAQLTPNGGWLDTARQAPASTRRCVIRCTDSGQCGLLFALGKLPNISLAAQPEFGVGGWVLSGLLLLACVWWINLLNFMNSIDDIARA